MAVQKRKSVPSLALTIAYHIVGEVVTIDRILYCGRDLAGAFEDE